MTHNGNPDAALKDAGDNWLTINGESWNSVKQREYLDEQNAEDPTTGQCKKSPTETLRAYSATGQSDELKLKMLADKFVLKGLAILGQWTVFYASPGTGKTLLTLWLISEQIIAGEVSPEDIFYVNVDDSYKGGVEKTKIAERVGFHVLLPSVNSFNKNDLLSAIDALVETEEASGKVIILDTLKKFTDIMDKKGASDFGDKARNFVAAGGTIICLAHTNKHKDADGQSVYSGTADIVDDADCAFIIEYIDSKQECYGEVEKQVEFRNIKARGDVEDKVAFTYTLETGAGYLSLFDSVKRLDANDVAQAKEQKFIKIGHKKDDVIVASIKEIIAGKAMGKTDLVQKVHDDTAKSRAKILEVLKRWEGEDHSKGHLWRCEKKGKNKMMYHLLKSKIEKMSEDILAAAGKLSEKN